MIVGLGHRARSGKDTVADYLVSNYGFEKMSWADPLKRACMEMFDWNEDHVYGHLKEVVDPRWGFAPRHALQQVGTNLLRTWIPDIHVRRIMMALPDGDIVIPDVRFPNEAEAILGSGGKLWRIDRPGLPHDDHESEMALTDYVSWTSIITNSGTVDDLYARVDEFMEAI